jgi:predicted DNA-binding protein YlxM (UPF0122 family)
MDDLYKLSLLIDFYGQLLTKRQFEIMDMYHNNDYSLGEIAESLNISRQGVYDNLKRAKNTLIQLESKLKLVEKFDKNNKVAVNLLKIIDEIDIESILDKDKSKINYIKKGISTIIENG